MFKSPETAAMVVQWHERAPNTPIHLGNVAASPAILILPNAGTDTVGSLVIDGVPQSSGLYYFTNIG
jgi:hypothetical protein